MTESLPTDPDQQVRRMRRGGGKNTAKVRYTRQLIEQYYSDGGILPLEVLMMTMRQAWRERDYEKAREIAVEAAPFLHPKYASIEVVAEEGGPSRVARLPAVVESIDEWRRAYDPSMKVIDAVPVAEPLK